MKHFISIFLLCFLTALTACEKADFSEPDSYPDEEQEENPDIIVEKDSTNTSALTVAQAIEAEYDSKVAVVGDIIGCTSRSMKNLKISSPFNSKSSIVISDTPATDDEELDFDVIMPVCINEYAPYQRDLNLVDHPELWGKRIFIYARTTSYLGVRGLKNILTYEIID